MLRSRLSSPIALAFVAVAIGLSLTAGSRLHGQRPGQPDSLPPGYTRDAKGGLVPPKSGGSVVPGVAYVSPAVGTREVYTNFTSVITGNDGWRTTFLLEKGAPGVRSAFFLPDDPKGELVYDPAVFNELWPLKVGRTLVMETQRFPDLWMWRFVVAGTERVTVRAGTFDTYVIESFEEPRTPGKKQPAYRRNAKYYFAPDINAIVRFTSEEFVGERRAKTTVVELVRLERPGKPLVGAPVTAARPAAPAGKKP